MLNEKALEAARSVVKATAIYNPTGDISTLADPAIRAYLAALPSSPVSELVERLEKRSKTVNGSLVGASDGGTYALGYYNQLAAKDDKEAASTLTTLSTRNAELERGIDRLAAYIMENVPGEPSENQGAVDTAIRLLGKNAELEREVKRLREAVDLLETANSLRRNSMGDVNYDTFYDGPSVEELEDQAHALSTSPQGGEHE